MAMMKSSNTEWLGDIPAEWDVAQIGNYYELRNEKVSDYDFEPLSVTMKGIVPQLATAAKSDDHSNRKLVKKGDFVINSRSDRRGSCGISPLDGSVSLINTVMEPRGEMNPQYYNWLFHTEQFADEFYKWGHGIVDDLWTTRWQEMKKILIVAPSPDEQQAIADYLDETCSKIDEIIAEAKASIDEYENLRQSIIFEILTKGLDNNVEMKDSGVEWIGKVPSHWMIGKVKYGTTKVGSGKTPKGGAEVYTTSGVMFLRSQNIYNDGLRLDNPYYISEEIDEEMKNTRVQKNDVLLNITGGSIGRCCIFDGSIPNANVNQHVCIIRVDPVVFLPEYMHLFWISPIGQTSIKLYQTGGNREGMSAEAIKNTPIPIISIAEQRRIVDFIKPNIEYFNVLIAEKESLINDLEAYKKSLIYEVVTGKRRVV